MSATQSLPAFLENLLESCPTAGSGVNNWLYAVAKQLHIHMDEDEMFVLLKAKSADCGRVVTGAELRHQIRCGRARAFQPRDPEAYAAVRGAIPRVVSVPPTRTDDPPTPRWPAPDHDAIRQIVTTGWSLADLWERSPLRFDDDRRHTEEIIDILFPSNPLLCCGLTKFDFATRRRETWRGHLERLAFITPNPMFSPKGLTQDKSRLSAHSLEATARRIYQIGEFDFAEYASDGVTLTQWAPLVQEWRAAGITVADACAALHMHLAERLPLVAAVSSAGKPSIHGWYAAFAHTDDQLLTFMRYAVSLGADKQLWTRSQFTRMPDGTRENGAVQTCFYLDHGKAIQS